jgi:hypothetical protein
MKNWWTFGDYMHFIVLAYMMISWVVNIVKLFGCDFAEPYKQEFIHFIGLLPGLSMITCWY